MANERRAAGERPLAPWMCSTCLLVPRLLPLQVEGKHTACPTPRVTRPSSACSTIALTPEIADPRNIGLRNDAVFHENRSAPICAAPFGRSDSLIYMYLCTFACDGGLSPICKRLSEACDHAVEGLTVRACARNAEKKSHTVCTESTEIKGRWNLPGVLSFNDYFLLSMRPIFLVFFVLRPVPESMNHHRHRIR